MAYLKIILEIARAIPTLIKLWKSWEMSRLKRQQDEEAKRRKEEIDRAIAEHDQRPIEEAIGNAEPGSPAKDQEGVETRPNKVRP